MSRTANFETVRTAMNATLSKLPSGLSWKLHIANTAAAVSPVCLPNKGPSKGWVAHISAHFSRANKAPLDQVFSVGVSLLARIPHGLGMVSLSPRSVLVHSESLYRIYLGEAVPPLSAAADVRSSNKGPKVTCIIQHNWCAAGQSPSGAPLAAIK